MDKNKSLMLDNQICFPLYATSREIIKKYRPYLDEIGLTYTQYIAMLVFWEQKIINVKDLGARLLIDSGTLTPVLKSLEKKGLVRRSRSREDERVLLVEITDEGMSLKELAKNIPCLLKEALPITNEECAELHRILYKLLDSKN